VISRVWSAACGIFYRTSRVRVRISLAALAVTAASRTVEPAAGRMAPGDTPALLGLAAMVFRTVRPRHPVVDAGAEPG